MTDRAAELLAGIEAGLLSDTASTASLLRKCIILGGRANSERLRDWASLELNGYETDAAAPEYRMVGGVIMLDAIAGNTVHTGHVISSIHLPKIADGQGITENFTLRQDIGELEELAKSTSGSLKFTSPLSPLIAREIDRRSGRPFQQTLAIYWSVTPATISGVVGRVRTALAELVAELVAHAPSPDTAPPQEVFDRAVNFIFTGERASVSISSTRTESGNAVGIQENTGVRTLGDTFSNISGSNIINRSLVASSLNSFEQSDKIEEAEALRQLAELVENSGNPEAGECLDSFNEELARPEPRKAILKAMWERILIILPYAANIAAIATGIGNIIS